MNSTEIPNRTDSDILTEMERLRKEAQTLKYVPLVFLVLCPVLLIVLSPFSFGAGAIAAFGSLIASVVFYVRHHYILARYKSHTNSFKSLVVKTELEKVFENLTFEPDSGWPISAVQSLNLFKYFNIYATNDLIKAKYKNVSFEQADIKLIDEHKETYISANGRIKKRTVRIVHFSGRMIKFKFDSYFPSNLRIVGRYFNGVSPSGWESIETASVDFNKKFLSSASDMPAALTVLKPQLIIKILDFYDRFGMPFAFYFKDNNMFLFLPGNETFELLNNKDLKTQKKMVLVDIYFLLKSLDVAVDIADDFIGSPVMVQKKSGARVMQGKNDFAAEAEEANLSHAPDVILEGNPGHLSGWKTDNVVIFKVNVKNAGRYGIILNYSKNSKDGDPSDLTITGANNSIAASLPSTGKVWNIYTEKKVGELDLPAGETLVILASRKSRGSKGKYVMNLRSIMFEWIE
jgi:Protein of unknown function (DUF3137).